jgi:hypothetical protein
MEFAWLEAAAMFGLFAAQFVLPAIVGEQAKLWIAIAFFVWAGIAVLIMLYKRRLPAAFSAFGETWREHVSR